MPSKAKSRSKKLKESGGSYGWIWLAVAGKKQVVSVRV